MPDLSVALLVVLPLFGQKAEDIIQSVSLLSLTEIAPYLHVLYMSAVVGMSILGGFYVAVMMVYVLFETVTVNYRPVLINGILETSYPSSTTLLVMCVIPTALMQVNSRMQSTTRKKIVALSMMGFLIFMVVGRLISGVHWVTDIVGGALLSAGLVMMYRYFATLR